ncbi:MAG: HD domain-containing protein [Acidobacteriia bacterium]|nr:HD domain-containing protein [Terriglobia bacterium]
MNSLAVPGVHETLASRTADVEERVRGAFTGSRFPSGVALIAGGGFGRSELFPHSDVDLVFVVESEHQIAPMKPLLSAFLQDLWDRGLRPSHAVQTVNYCATDHDDNIELTISLLDRRFLAGDEAMFRWLDERFRAFIAKRGGAIADKLVGLAQGRRAKFHDTVYHLEPNLKDGPGGLRDLQTVRWLAALTPRVTAPDLSDAFNFLAAIRVRIHESAGRDQNLLSFDIQESLAADPAALMRDYFRHARGVDRAARRAMETAQGRPGNLIERFQDLRSRFSTTEFTVLRDRVWLRAPAAVERGLGLFEFVARHELRLAFDTLDRLQGCAPETSWADWRALLSLPHSSLGLRAMQESGVLVAALPEWKHIDCLVVRDFYHQYTVDEHTLVALDSLASIEDRRFADLWSEIDDPAAVRFALLVHDIGKGSGRDHVEESAQIAREVMKRLNAPEADRATIEFLILHHLDLSTVMTSRDLTDESTAQMLAERVGTVERLKRLTLLTYADISAVNPHAMTPWRLEQLWRVYLLAYAELTKTLYTDRIHDAAGERAAFLEGLPVRYLRTHTDSEIEVHMALAQQLESRPVAIEIVHERGFYRLTLLTRDHPGLFSSVAGAISSFGLSILKAEAFSNAHGIVVDTFTFSDPHRSLELNPPEVDRLRGIVRKVVEGKLDAAQLLKGRPKPLLPSRGARFEPRVRLDDSASETATLIEIVAEDRAGLLYDLTRVLSAADCNIEVVLIDTEAHRALDVFYVTSGGGKLDVALAEKLGVDLKTACAP